MSEPSPSRPWITVVSGLPRSGTSLMMQMLHAGGIPALTDQIRAADTDNPRGYYEFEAVKRTKADASWIPQALGKSVKLVHLLLYDLPDGYDYRVLLMRRNIHEVLASQQAMLQRLGPPGGTLPPEKLAAIFTQQLEQVQAYLKGKPNFRVLEVDYNRLVREPGPHVERMQAFLDAGLDTAAMIAAIDPALYRKRG